MNSKIAIAGAVAILGTGVALDLAWPKSVMVRQKAGGHGCLRLVDGAPKWEGEHVAFPREELATPDAKDCEPVE